jgi:hypothetical protein
VFLADFFFSTRAAYKLKNQLTFPERSIDGAGESDCGEFDARASSGSRQRRVIDRSFMVTWL